MGQTSSFQVDAHGALDAVAQAVVITDAQGVIRFWNRAAEGLFGWTSAEVLGQPVLAVTPAEHVMADAEEVLEQLFAGHVWTGEMVLRRRDGETFLARVTDTPMRDAHGTVVGIIGVSEDITGLRATEVARAATEERLRLALAAGTLGTWHWDMLSNVVEWDSYLEALCGIPAGTFGGTYEAWLQVLHPEDRPAVLGAVDDAVRTGDRFSVEHRVVWPDGTTRWVEGRGDPVTENGKVTGYIGVMRDITERREADEERTRLLRNESAAREAAEAANDRLAFLADATAALSATFDLDERLDLLAKAGVPRFADCCAVHLVTEDGSIEPVTVHHADADLQRRLRLLSDRWPVRLDADAGVGFSIREGKTSWVPAVTDAMLAAVAQDPVHLDILRTLDINAGVSIPLRGRGAPVGAITFFTTGDRTLSQDDVRLVQELCLRAGVLVENATLLHARERDRVEQRYHAALLNTLFEASIDGILVVDPDGQVLSYNHRFLELWDLDTELVDAGDDESLLREAMTKVVDPDGFMACVYDPYAGSPSPARDEVRLRTGRVLDRHGTALHSEDGQYLGWAWNFRDITRERAQQAEIAATGERLAAIARTLQESLLPPRLPSPDGIELAARYRPAWEGVEVGGDFYDVFAVGDDWLVVLGDVCGKGVEAAQLTGLVRWSIRAAAMHSDDPAAVLNELNAVMLTEENTGEGRFATVCCMRLRLEPDGALIARIASAGHPAPLLLRTNGSIQPVPTSGMPVGLFNNIDIDTATVRLATHESLIALTDGVLEARDAEGNQFDEAGVEQALAGMGGASAAEISHALATQALEHQDGVAHDDIAVLVVRAKGAPIAPR